MEEEGGKARGKETEGGWVYIFFGVGFCHLCVRFSTAFQVSLSVGLLPWVGGPGVGSWATVSGSYSTHGLALKPRFHHYPKMNRKKN